MKIELVQARLEGRAPASIAGAIPHAGAVGHGRTSAEVWELGAASCLVALIGAAALDGTSLKLHGLSVYPEYMALGLVGLWTGAATALRQLEWYIPPTLLPLCGWLAVELLATILHAPNRSQSLVLWGKLLLMVATYLLVLNLARSRLLLAVKAQGAVAAGVALTGIAAYVSWRLTGSHLGMQHPGRNLGPSWLPAGTLREPDIFGSYLVASTLLTLPIALFSRRSDAGLRRLMWSVAALSVLGVVASGSRTAWLALLAALCMPVVLFAAGHPGQFVRHAALPFLAVAAITLAFIGLRINPARALPAFNPHQNGDLIQRAVSFGSLSHDRDVVARVEIAENALVHAREHIVTGWGVGAYGEAFTYPPPDTIHAGWISNLPIHLLYDGGLLGLAAFTWAIVLAGVRGVHAWSSSSGMTEAMMAGLLLALLGLLIAFQATEATWFAYPWIVLGLLEAAVFSQRHRVPAELVP